MNQDKEKDIDYKKISFMFGVTSLLSLLSCSFYNIAIVSGVGAICAAIYSRENKRMPGVSKAGMALGIFGSVFGVIEFLYLVYFHTLLKDPEWAPFFTAVFNNYWEHFSSLQR